ncbi:MAG TPA: hypothetical protein VMD09_16195 [Solirubrobacteraceae bacterium]|nr:hypothetical protein [Solirubrobacteraceae bacterium]
MARVVPSHCVSRSGVRRDVVLWPTGEVRRLDAVLPNRLLHNNVLRNE